MRKVSKMLAKGVRCCYSYHLKIKKFHLVTHTCGNVQRGMAQGMLSNLPSVSMIQHKLFSHNSNIKLFPRSPTPCHTVYQYAHLSTNSSSSDNERELADLREMFKDDPEVKTWLKELSDDFHGEKDSIKTDSTDLSHSDDDGSLQDSNVNDIITESDRNPAKPQAVDIDKEMMRYNIEEFYGIDEQEDETEEEDTPYETTLPISKDRGIHGVFDVEDMVALLKSENASDICVIHVPPSYDYVDYMVLVTGRSLRHLKAMAFFIKWVYKQKRRTHDKPSCKVEGLNSNDWLAIDLGNIAVHLMLAKTRSEYDLETLWTVGPEYDSKMNEAEDPFTMMFASDEQLSIELPVRQGTADNVLTLSEKVDYVYPEEEQTSVEYKFRKEQSEKMENVAGWHTFDEDKGSPPKR